MVKSTISLEKGEKIIQEIKPNKTAFKKSNLLKLIGYSIPAFPFVTAFLWFVVFILVSIVQYNLLPLILPLGIRELENMEDEIHGVAFSVQLIVEIILFIIYIRKFNANMYENASYVITNKRLEISSGLWGKNKVVLTYDKISNAEVKVGPFDKKYGTGSVKIYTSIYEPSMHKHGPSMSNVNYVLSNIENPNAVLQVINKQLRNKKQVE
ncbi:PH domain-containing protein [Candidatus Woesearchaeota archaeon]|nr:PH domain-containing protein [Candidatus Woesearchaeota archaeon]